jgi:hypothetical protein
MNISMAQENIALQNDNKQLGALVKEYEQALDQIMGAFRTQAVCYPRCGPTRQKALTDARHLSTIRSGRNLR